MIRARQPEHEHILETCASGEAESAADALRAHLRRTEQLVIAQLLSARQRRYLR